MSKTLFRIVALCITQSLIASADFAAVSVMRSETGERNRVSGFMQTQALNTVELWNKRPRALLSSAGHSRRLVLESMLVLGPIVLANLANAQPNGSQKARSSKRNRPLKKQSEVLNSLLDLEEAYQQNDDEKIKAIEEMLKAGHPLAGSVILRDWENQHRELVKAHRQYLQGKNTLAWLSLLGLLATMGTSVATWISHEQVRSDEPGIVERIVRPYAIANIVAVLVGFVAVYLAISFPQAIPQPRWDVLKYCLWVDIAFPAAVLSAYLLDKRRGARAAVNLILPFWNAGPLCFTGLMGIVIGWLDIPGMLVPSIVLTWVCFQYLCQWIFQIFFFKTLPEKSQKRGIAFFTAWRWISWVVVNLTIVLAEARFWHLPLPAPWSMEADMVRGIYAWLFTGLAILEGTAHNIFDLTIYLYKRRLIEGLFGPWSGILGRQLNVMRREVALAA